MSACWLRSCVHGMRSLSQWWFLSSPNWKFSTTNWLRPKTNRNLWNASTNVRNSSKPSMNFLRLSARRCSWTFSSFRFFCALCYSKPLRWIFKRNAKREFLIDCVCRWKTMSFNWRLFSSTFSPWLQFCGCITITQMKSLSTWVENSIPNLFLQIPIAERSAGNVSLHVSVVQPAAWIPKTRADFHEIIKAHQNSSWNHRHEVGHVPCHLESVLQLFYSVDKHRLTIESFMACVTGLTTWKFEICVVGVKISQISQNFALNYRLRMFSVLMKLFISSKCDGNELLTWLNKILKFSVRWIFGNRIKRNLFQGDSVSIIPPCLRFC